MNILGHCLDICNKWSIYIRVKSFSTCVILVLSVGAKHFKQPMYQTINAREGLCVRVKSTGGIMIWVFKLFWHFFCNRNCNLARRLPMMVGISTVKIYKLFIFLTLAFSHRDIYKLERCVFFGIIYTCNNSTYNIVKTIYKIVLHFIIQEQY